MKKKFKLVDSVKKTERIADSIKHEIKKYLKRERNKKLPEKVHFWDFYCRIGISESNATEIDLKDIGKQIDLFVKDEVEQFYLEILAKHGFKSSFKNK